MPRLWLEAFEDTSQRCWGKLVVEDELNNHVAFMALAIGLMEGRHAAFAKLLEDVVST